MCGVIRNRLQGKESFLLVQKGGMLSAVEKL
jgi:hypothetical protein